MKLLKINSYFKNYEDAHVLYLFIEDQRIAFTYTLGIQVISKGV